VCDVLRSRELGGNTSLHNENEKDVIYLKIQRPLQGYKRKADCTRIMTRLYRKFVVGCAMFIVITVSINIIGGLYHVQTWVPADDNTKFTAESVLQTKNNRKVVNGKFQLERNLIDLESYDQKNGVANKWTPCNNQSNTPCHRQTAVDNTVNKRGNVRMRAQHNLDLRAETLIKDEANFIGRISENLTESGHLEDSTQFLAMHNMDNSKTQTTRNVGAIPFIWNTFADGDRLQAQLDFIPKRFPKESPKESPEGTGDNEASSKVIVIEYGVAGIGVSEGDRVFREQQCPVKDCTIVDGPSMVANGMRVDARVFKEYFVFSELRTVTRVIPRTPEQVGISLTAIGTPLGQRKWPSRYDCSTSDICPSMFLKCPGN
jgi:hypothetical protein